MGKNEHMYLGQSSGRGQENMVLGYYRSSKAFDIGPSVDHIDVEMG